MEDSFDARLNGEYKPPRAEKKGGKGWMITSIILLLLLIGAGTFAGIMLFSNNNNGDKMLASEKQVAEKDAKISELEKTISEKDAEIATLKNASVTPGGNTETAKKYSDFKLDLAGLMKLINKDNKDYPGIVSKSLDLVKAEFTSDDKYLILATEIMEGQTGYLGVYYKEVGANTSWKVQFEGHQFSCENATAEQKKFAETYKSFDDGMGSNYVQCVK